MNSPAASGTRATSCSPNPTGSPSILAPTTASGRPSWRTPGSGMRGCTMRGTPPRRCLLLLGVPVAGRHGHHGLVKLRRLRSGTHTSRPRSRTTSRRRSTRCCGDPKELRHAVGPQALGETPRIGARCIISETTSERHDRRAVARPPGQLVVGDTRDRRARRRFDRRRGVDSAVAGRRDHPKQPAGSGPNRTHCRRGRRRHSRIDPCWPAPMGHRTRRHRTPHHRALH